MKTSTIKRVALVTGAGRGIGRAIAIAFAKSGFRVAITARTVAELTDVADEIRAAGGETMTLAADLSDRAAPARIVQAVKRELGPVEILVNNAGIGSSQDPRPLVDFDDDFWDLTMAVNVTAPYLLCKQVLPDMLTRNWGRILTIASINGKVGSLHGAAYSASKHAILGLTKTIALEVARHGVTANAICPGPVRTVLNDRRIAYDAERLGTEVAQLETSMTPLGRRLEPEEIAPLAVYLASDAAAAVTGQAYNIDGGVVMSG